MMVPETRTSSRLVPNTLPLPGMPDGDGGASGGASGFLMLLGLVPQPATTPRSGALAMLAGATPGAAMDGDATTAPALPVGDAADSSSSAPAAANTADASGVDGLIEPMGLRALVEARLAAQIASADARRSGDPRRPTLFLPNPARLVGTTYLNMNPVGRITGRANAIDRIETDAAGSSQSAAIAAAVPTTAALMMAIAAQQQLNAANASARRAAELASAADSAATSESGPQSSTNVTTAAPARPIAATPLIELSDPKAGTQQMVSAVMALVDALSPVRTAPAASEPADPASQSGDADNAASSGAAVPAGLGTAHQPMLRDVELRSLWQRGSEHGAGNGSQAPSGDASGDASSDRRREEKDRASAGPLTVHLTAAREGSPAVNVTFGDAVRSVRASLVADAQPVDAPRPAVAPAKPQALASQATLDLDPASGAGRVRVAIRGDTVHATIIAPDGDVSGLTSQVHELRRALEARGFAEAHVAVRGTGGDAPSTSNAPASGAVSGELATSSTRESKHEGNPEQRNPRAPLRDPADQRSPRRRPRREEEMA